MHNELLALLNIRGPILANLGGLSTCRHLGEYIDSKLETIASIFWRNFPFGCSYSLSYKMKRGDDIVNERAFDRQERVRK